MNPFRQFLQSLDEDEDEDIQELSQIHHALLGLAQLRMLNELLTLEESSAPSQDIKCPVCMDEDDQLIRLPCRHFYGRNCLKETLLQQLQERGLTKVPCIPPCENFISVQDFLYFATPEERQIFEEKLFDLNIISGIKPNEKFIYCSNQKCKTRVAIWDQADYFTCPSCKKKQCAKCLKDYHVSKVSCVQAFIQSLSKKELEHIQSMVNQGMKMCPHCLGYIQKNGGCNLMNCFSDVCRGNKYFCWICLEKLQKGNQFNHFVGSNPFNEKCSGQLVKKQKVEQQLNKVPRPRCKTQDPKICELIQNLGDLVCYCKSCKSHICTSCHRDVQVENLDKHFSINEQGIKCDGRCVIF